MRQSHRVKTRQRAPSSPARPELFRNRNGPFGAKLGQAATRILNRYVTAPFVPGFWGQAHQGSKDCGETTDPVQKPVRDFL